MSMQPIQSCLLQDFTSIEGLKDKLDLKNGSVIAKNVAIKALENIERNNKIKAFFTKRSVIVLAGALIFLGTVAAVLINPAAIAALPTFLKVCLVIVRFSGLGIIFLGLFDGNSSSDAYKYRALDAGILIARLKRDSSNSIQLVEHLKPKKTEELNVSTILNIDSKPVNEDSDSEGEVIVKFKEEIHD